MLSKKNSNEFCPNFRNLYQTNKALIFATRWYAKKEPKLARECIVGSAAKAGEETGELIMHDILKAAMKETRETFQGDRDYDELQMIERKMDETSGKNSQVFVAFREFNGAVKELKIKRRSSFIINLILSIHYSMIFLQPTRKRKF